MAEPSRTKGVIKFAVWGILSVIMVWYTWHSYSSGQMVTWYYWEASEDGYAVEANGLRAGTKEKPVALEVGTFPAIAGLQAVKVKKGDRLPQGCNGIITEKVIKEGKRAALEGNTLKVMVPTQVREAKGFKYKDTFKHKGVKTNPWSGVQNLFMVIGMGFCLGYMAEGFTDMLGLKLHKIKHYEGAH
ncbi:MAG: hypothetical protein LLG06_17035 [Desulfobacteraceae bacterium]|nr:hypothetical protein [Desulfobacteraceae bacterium]